MITGKEYLDGINAAIKEDVDTELQRPVADKEGVIELQPDSIPSKTFCMVFKVPVVEDPLGRETGNKRFIRMCDYSSAGNTWDHDLRFRVWLPIVADLSSGRPGR